jgi:predicted anti-sigma-YlaC factor YlaD
MTQEPGPGRCDRVLLLLSIDADGAATPQQVAEIQAHLPGCAACRRARAADAAVRARLLERTRAVAPAWAEGFAERTAGLAIAQAREARAQNRLLWLSAAAALAVAAVTPAALARREAALDDGTATARDSTRLALVAPMRPRAPEGGK